MDYDVPIGELPCSGRACYHRVPCIFPIAIGSIVFGALYIVEGNGCLEGKPYQAFSPSERDKDRTDCELPTQDYFIIGTWMFVVAIIVLVCASKVWLRPLWQVAWDLGWCRRCPSVLQFIIRSGLDRGPATELGHVAAAQSVAVAVDSAEVPLESIEAPPLRARPSDRKLRLVADEMINSAAENHAECCICFEAMYLEPIATLTADGQNACAHFLHARCARDLLHTENAAFENAKFCPMCRMDVNGMRTVPNIMEDPEGWFFCVDVEGDGRLSKQQVLNILTMQFPVDLEKLEAHLPTLWSRWDRDGSGFVSKQEFLDPDVGLLRFVRSSLLREEPATSTSRDVAKREPNGNP